MDHLWTGTRARGLDPHHRPRGTGATCSRIFHASSIILAFIHQTTNCFPANPRPSLGASQVNGRGCFPGPIPPPCLETVTHPPDPYQVSSSLVLLAFGRMLSCKTPASPWQRCRWMASVSALSRSWCNFTFHFAGGRKGATTLPEQIRRRQ